MSAEDQPNGSYDEPVKSTSHDRTEHIGPSIDHEVDDPNGVWVAGFATGACLRKTAEMVKTADAADKVAQVIIDSASARRVPQGKTEQSGFLRDEAAKARASTGISGQSGRRGQLKGYLFEDLDIEAYNAKNAKAGRIMKKRKNPLDPVYDADRFIDGQYAGSVQHKSSAVGASEAVSKMEQKKPGSAAKGTIRVPADQVEETLKRTHGRARVAGSDVTSEQLEHTLDSGLGALAKDGAKATSTRRALAKGAGKAGATSAAIGGLVEASALLRGDIDAMTFTKRRVQDAGEAAVATAVANAAERVGQASAGGRAVAQGAARSAVVMVAVSSLRDVPSLVRGDLSFRDFAENRGVDAAEAAAATAVGSAATSVILATAGGAAASSAVGGAAASAAASVAVAAAGTGTVTGAAVATTLGGVTAAVAGPVIIGGAVVVVTGLLVGKGLKTVRRRVKGNQERRRAADETSVKASTAPTLALAEPQLVEVQLTLNGSNVFTAEQVADIRHWLLELGCDDSTARDQASRRLNELRFLVSDWAKAGEPFTADDFDALTASGYVVNTDESLEPEGEAA